MQVIKHVKGQLKSHDSAGGWAVVTAVGASCERLSEASLEEEASRVACTADGREKWTMEGQSLVSVCWGYVGHVTVGGGRMGGVGPSGGGGG